MKGDVELVRVGEVPHGILEHIATCVERVYELSVVRHECDINPSFAFDSGRDQYWSTLILQRLEAMRSPACDSVLGVTQVDLFVPILTFVFGEALLSRPPAVISLCRLNPEFYGLPKNPIRTLERTSTEAIHELGHTFGLLHCSDYACAMHASHSADEVDLKGPGLCAECIAAMDETGGEPVGGPGTLAGE